MTEKEIYKTRVQGIKIDIHYARIQLRKLKKYVKRYGKDNVLISYETIQEEKNYIKKLKKELKELKAGDNE